MKRSSQLSASVTFLSAEEGGFQQPRGSGIKPLLKVGEVFTSCIVWGASEDQQFLPGIEYRVELELPLWQEYKDLIYAGMAVQLNQGSRQVVARGIVLEKLA